MALYYYNKYNVDSSIDYRYQTVGGWDYRGASSFALGTTMSNVFYLDRNSGYYTGGEVPLTSVGYIGSGTTIERHDVTEISSRIYCQFYRLTCEWTAYTVYSQGSLVESNIGAADGTYPFDGQSGGYWYVRQGLVPSFFFMNF